MNRLIEEKNNLYESLDNAIPVPAVRDYYINKTKNLFPEALEMVGNSSHQVWTIGKLLPVRAPLSASHLTYIEVFDAPLLMTGLKRSYDCGECNRKGHIILLNCRFLTFMNYLLYFVHKAIDKKFEKPDLDRLSELVNLFLSGKHVDSEFKSPPNGIWNTLTEMAFSWIMFHEIAHIVQKISVNMELVPDSFSNKSIVVEELSSDISALKFLQYRMVAHRPLDKEGIAHLYLGAEFFIRILAVVKAIYLTDISPIKSKNPNSGLYHPSPHLRISIIENLTHHQVKLGLIDESIVGLRVEFNSHLEGILNQIFMSNGIN